MADQWKIYVDDPRTVCRYGARCYQKNADHHKRYKHPPPNLKRKANINHTLGPPKKNPVAIENESTIGSDNQSADSEATPTTAVSASTGYDAPACSDICIPDDLEYYEYNENSNSVMKDLFMVEMPNDFYKFFECITNENKDVDNFLAAVNLQLVGPYDFLLGKLPKLNNKDLYLVHWRYFYDPPEFQTIMKYNGDCEFHYGYYRDCPEDSPVFIGSNDSSKDCIIVPVAYNIFGAVYFHLQNEKRKSPFKAIACQKLMEKVKKWADDNSFTLDAFDMKRRQAQIQTKTLHGAGIVGPYNKKTKLGYRPLVESNASIKTMFKKLASCSTQLEKDKILSDLQPVITYANIAVDECDFITGLECGINLFCSGILELEAPAINCMCSAYLLLKRPAFLKILKSHIKYRRKGSNMSIMSFKK